MKHIKSGILALVILLNVVFSTAKADAIPDCRDNKGNILPVMNEQALLWKSTKPNQYLQRALIEGTFVAVTLDRDSHFQFTVQIGKDPKKDLIEVIYNKSFGDIPEVKAGMKISACGDFINSFAPINGYPQSPAGAIIHWVHMNPKTRENSKDHPDGYIVMGGTLVGHENPEK